MSQDSLDRAHQLEVAFDAFNQVSLQLEASYRDLENRVSLLNQELAAARSERLKQLAEKERIANRLERLLDLLPGGVLVLDGTGQITEHNPAALELLGEPLTGQSWQGVIERSFVRGSRDASEVTLVNDKRISISTRALGSEPGQIVLLMDVTEPHALQELLNRQDRLSAMGEMAASLAHQVRTPLATAMLYISHLRKPVLQEQDRIRFADRISSRLKHLEQMVNDMLQFARGGSFDMQNIALHELFQDFAQTIEPQLQECKGALHLPVNDQAVILGNREALGGVLLNLATNAMQVKGEDVQIEVIVEHLPQEIILHFRDNGPGIAEKNRSRIFTPFFTTRPDGTGLGLAVVQSVIHAHRGEIQLEDTPQQGCSFAIRLPLAESRQALPSGVNGKQSSGVLH